MASNRHNNVSEIKNKEREKRDEEANNYISFVESVYGPYRSKAYTETILHFLKLAKDQVWLDAGSGVGRLSIVLAPRVKHLDCTDHSEVSLTLLENTARNLKITNISTSVSDLTTFNGGDAVYDGILCNEVIQHIPTYAERLETLKNLYRMLKPEGRCLVNVIRWRNNPQVDKEGYWGKNDEIYRNYFTSQEVEALMKDAGFMQVDLRGLDILPLRLAQFLPKSFSWVDRLMAMLPMSANYGNNLLVIGRKGKG